MLLKDSQAAWETPAVTTHGFQNHTVRSEGWRYIRYANGDEELYHNATDPHEYTNLAGIAEHAARKAELAKWLPKTDAPNLPSARKSEADANKCRKGKEGQSETVRSSGNIGDHFMPTRQTPLLLRAVLISALLAASLTAVGAEQPNVVIIFADDLGYGDLGCYGSPTIRTPHLDRMAAEGLRFTDFYSAAEVCTPSRAALLTGRYPIRSGMCGNRRVLFPNSQGGLPPAEITIAEALKPHGYATAHIGKWHLGIHAGGRPLDQGFDHSFGLPYSNDMDGRPGLAPRRVRFARSAARRLERAAAARWQGRRATRRSDHAHAALHGGSGAVHPREEGRAVLPLFRAHFPPRADVRLARVQGQEPRRHLRRRGRGDSTGAWARCSTR